jgi:hypothetical protein
MCRASIANAWWWQWAPVAIKRAPRGTLNVSLCH